MIDKILAKAGNSNAGQKFFKWAAKPANEKVLNHVLPQVETVIATGCYMVSTARQKNIDEDRRSMLQIQHFCSGIVGLFVASAASKKVSSYGEEVIKCLDPSKVLLESISKIKAGLRVGLPILTTMFCMRFLIPSAIALFSGRIMDRVRDKRKEELDIKA